MLVMSFTIVLAWWTYRSLNYSLPTPLRARSPGQHVLDTHTWNYFNEHFEMFDQLLRFQYPSDQLTIETPTLEDTISLRFIQESRSVISLKIIGLSSAQSTYWETLCRLAQDDEQELLCSSGPWTRIYLSNELSRTVYRIPIQSVAQPPRYLGVVSGFAILLRADREVDDALLLALLQTLEIRPDHRPRQEWEELIPTADDSLLVQACYPPATLTDITMRGDELQFRFNGDSNLFTIRPQSFPPQLRQHFQTLNSRQQRASPDTTFAIGLPDPEFVALYQQLQKADNLTSTSPNILRLDFDQEFSFYKIYESTGVRYLGWINDSGFEAREIYSSLEPSPKCRAVCLSPWEHSRTFETMLSTVDNSQICHY